MKTFTIILLLTAAALETSCQIIQVTEIAKSKKEIIDFSTTAIVDINSQLEISLDQAHLLLKIGNQTKTDKALLDRLEQINNLLVNQIAILEILKADIAEASLADDITKLGEYSILMNDFYTRLTENAVLRARANELFGEYFRERATLDNSIYPSPQAYVIKNFSLDEKEIINQIKNTEAFKKVRIRLVAFLQTRGEYNRKVHIENFDNYSAGEFYEVERWATTFSDEDLKAFEENRELAKRLNTIIDSNIKDLNTLLSKSFQSVECFKTLLEKNLELLDNAADLFGNNAIALTSLTAIRDDLRTIYELIKSLQDTKEVPEGQNVLQLFNQKRKGFIDAGKQLGSNIKAAIGKLPQEILQSPAITSFNTDITSCIQKLESDIKMVEDIADLTQNLLVPFKNSATAAAEIGDEVLSFTLQEIPETGYIDLKTTGKRENGDEIHIKVIAVYEKDTLNGSEIVLESRSITMRQISAHLVPNVNVILASPFNKSNSVVLDRDFQFAPSGSFLLKSDSRNNETWNFLSPGIGFNIATPDFDLDGTPDVAVGGVLTIIKDIVSIGLSYNTKTDSPLWFFGLSLPFGTLGFPINNIQTENK